MYVEKSKLGISLLQHGLILEVVQMILSYLKSFGKYEDEKVLVLVNEETDGYYVEYSS